MQSKYQRKRGPGEKKPQTEESEPAADVKDLYKDVEK
jgi:hypothetical protein